MAKLYFNYAAMNAGKSTTLLQSSFNYRERGMSTLIYTAALDKRAGQGYVASRIGLKEKARTFSDNTNLFDDVQAVRTDMPVDCIFVDESQFLSPVQVDQLARIVDRLNIPVLCYGLRTDFQGNLFPGSERLFALADEIRELKTICHCGRKATMNLRINHDGRAVVAGASVEIGGNERYVPLCRKHFFEKIDEANNQPNAS
ncbi:MAG: thymidine kinase [Parvularculaceae bacterium]|nr:thymidine kinase [Parvularculaceae bacterium]